MSFYKNNSPQRNIRASAQQQVNIIVNVIVKFASSMKEIRKKSLGSKLEPSIFWQDKQKSVL